MRFWKTTVLAAALLAAAAAGAAFAPAAQGQARAPRAERQDRSVVQLLRGGGEIGVGIRDLTDEETKGAKTPLRGGAVVTSVTDDSPAAAAGIKKGDVITEFDGERIRSARQFVRVVEETPVGRRVEAVIMRDGQRVAMTLAPRAGRGGIRLLGDFSPGDFHFEMPDIPIPPTPPAPPAVPAPVIPRDMLDFFGRSSSRLGITVEDLAPQLAQYFGTKDGVLVSSVRDDSVAAKAGLKAGDVITSFNNEPVTSASELRRQIQRTNSGGEFTIGIMRDKKATTLKGKLEPPAERVRTYVS